MRFVAVVVMALGCAQGGANGANGQDGKSGQDGATGATGPAGPPGAPGGGYRWHDVNGAAVTASSDLLVWDGNGRAWYVEPETGQIAGYPVSSVYFTSGDCSGPGLILSGMVRPRFVATGMEAIAAELPSAFMVRPDGVQADEVCVGSSMTYLGSCTAAAGCLSVVRVDDLVDAGSPPAGFEGPLHPEPTG